MFCNNGNRKMTAKTILDIVNNNTDNWSVNLKDDNKILYQREDHDLRKNCR